MSETAKKALEYGLSFALLCGAIFYLNTQMQAIKAEHAATSQKLEICVEDKMQLSTRVAALEAIIHQGEEAAKLPAPRKSK